MLAADVEFDAHVHRSLPALSGFLAVIFLCFVGLGVLDRSAGAAWPWILGTDVASCLVYLLGLLALRVGWLGPRLAYPVGLVFALLPAANSVLAFGLTGDLFFLSYMPMLAIGCGAYMLSLPWLWLGFGIMAAGSWVVAAEVLSPLEAAQNAPALVGAFLVSSFILVVRRCHIIESQRALLALRREAEERKRAEEHLAHVQRLESVGKLASGIAHDFNNLLMVILGYTQSMLEVCEDKELVAELEVVQGAGQSAAALAAKLLAFGRQQVMQPQTVDANALVRDVHALLRKAMPADVELVLQLDPAAGAVEVDPVQIEQVLVNLALNARDAMATGGGRLTFSTRPVASGPRPVVEIGVRDTGAGMSEEVQRRAFEPFYTTKEVGRGTGLGLAMVHGIISQSDGEIDIDSVVDVGTTVTVRLPRVAARPQPEVGAARSAEVELTGLTALVVDDEAPVRGMVVRMLEDRGCRTMQAGDAAGALALADTHAVDLLVLDVVMPGMSGVELLSRLRRRGHGQPALLMSGHAAEKVAEAGGLNAPLLHKPFSSDELLWCLSRLLRRSA